MANVSIATVSRVMNHSGKVSEKTRKKVEKIMAEIDYTPNAFAQGLGLNTMHAVGILVPTIADTFMAASVDYLEKKLAEEGYNCILSCRAEIRKRPNISGKLRRRSRSLRSTAI